MDGPHFIIHSLADGHLGCFRFGDINEYAAMNVYVVFTLTCVFISLGYIPRSGIAGHTVTLCLTF